MQEAQGQVERLGDDGRASRTGSAARATGPVGLPSAPVAWMDFSTSVALGPAKRRRRVSPLVSPTARPSTSAGFFLLLGSLGLLGRSMVLCSVTTVVALGNVGQEGRGKVEIDDGRVARRAGRAWRCRSLLGGHRILLAVERPGELRGCRGAHLGARERRGQELLHVAQAGGPLHQRAHRRAVALDLRSRRRPRSWSRSGRSSPRRGHWRRSGR